MGLGDILIMIHKHYDKLPEKIHAKLPMKRILILTQSDSEE